MKTYNRTCKCGAAFEAQDHRIKNCPACREAKAAAEAARPFKTCAHCGKQEQIRRGHNWCVACRQELEAARMVQLRAEIKARRRREYHEQQAKRQAQEGSFMEWFDTLTDAEAHEVLVGLRAAAAELGITVPGQEVPPAEEVNPEEQPHANQDAIDSAFASIMKGFEL